MASEDEREEELGTLTAIFPELVLDAKDPFSATLELPVAPANPLLVRFIPSANPTTRTDYAAAAAKSYVERDVELSHLPPLTLRVTLPKDYPENASPNVHLSAQADWLPNEKVKELEEEAEKLWEEYGRCQILFAYIDFLQQSAERGFDLSQSSEGCLVLANSYEHGLVSFDSETRLKVFEQGTYDCGVCLEPKKGSACYKMSRCGHVFCKQCLQDFYNNAITEGDVAGVRCLDPSCGKEKKKKRKTERTIHPCELFAMGIEESMVRRYLEMKRKKRLETDKTTVYCPRTWCQGPARSKLYPPIPADLSTYVSNEPSSDEESDTETDVKGPPAANGKSEASKIPPDPSDRLAICEKCELAFCKVCYMGWHGQYARCYPRDPNELSAEEKASYDYIRKHTSPCAYCNAPVQKTMGCNHMNCFQCRTHFCYLCGSWLDGANPYQHFNKAGTPCYQRLWELEEGDEGQGPEDGRGFAGGRGWEQMAIDVARQADEAEAEEAAARAQAEEDEHAQQPAAGPQPAEQDIPIIIEMEQVDLEDDDDDHVFNLIRNQAAPAPPPPQRGGRGGRRQRAANPFPPNPRANGAAQAVRNHERLRGGVRGRGAANAGRGRGRGGGAPPAVRMGDGRHDLDDRQQEELQRFLEMARNDQEDAWDSDELGDEDEHFVIRERNGL